MSHIDKWDDPKFGCLYLNDMRQTKTLEYVKRMIQSLWEPRTNDCYLLRIPLLEEVQNPKIVVDFASHKVDVVAQKVYVALTELFAGARHIL